MTDELRDLERRTIREFVGSHTFRGHVLDFGCGDAPYRDLVERDGATWHGYDEHALPASRLPPEPPPGIVTREAALKPAAWDEVLTTQILHLIPVSDLPAVMEAVCRALKPGGFLVITETTTWPDIGAQDLHRFTISGARDLIEKAGFAIIELKYRGSFDALGNTFPLGWACIAVAP